MRRARVLLVGLAIVALAAGCANLRSWERVQVGMEPARVKAIMGPPRGLDAGDDGQGLKGVWTYTNILGNRRYEIIFDKGKVVEKHVLCRRLW